MIQVAIGRPRTGAEWRDLALALAALRPGDVPAAEAGELGRLKDTAWDVASCAAFWHTVQLPSLGPGLLPWVVMLLAMFNAVLAGHGPEAWPDPASPFVLWPSLWLLGWFGLTLGLAAVRHARAKRQVLRLGAQLGLFAGRRV